MEFMASHEQILHLEIQRILREEVEFAKIRSWISVVPDVQRLGSFALSTGAGNFFVVCWIWRVYKRIKAVIVGWSRGIGELVSVFLKDKGKRIRDKQKEPKGGEKDKGKRQRDKG